MEPTAELKQKVMDRVSQAIRLAKEHYKRDFHMPTVEFDLRGTVAGQAFRKSWKIRYNGMLLARYGDHFIEDTVDHEVAHLIADVVYPDPETTYIDTKRGKRRAPQEVHGPKFKEVMAVLGAPDDSRVHRMDTEGIAVPKTKWHYRCAQCGRNHSLGVRLHDKLVKKPTSVICAEPCNGELVFVQKLGKVTFDKARQIFAGTADVPPDALAPEKKMKAPQYGSKLYICWQWFQGYHSIYTRADMIQVFQQEADCTKAGAATYYATCKKLWDAGV